MAIYNREDSRTALPQIERRTRQQLNDFLIVKKYKHTYGALNNVGDTMNWVEGFKLDGYYPIGIVGYRSGSSNGELNIARLHLEERKNGYCKLRFFGRAVATISTADNVAEAYVLWQKIE